MRLWVFDHYKGSLGIPEEGQGGDDEATWARFRKWLKALEERPSIKNTLSEKEHYLPICKYFHGRERQRKACPNRGKIRPALRR